MSKMRYTKKDFEDFKRECRRCLDKLGLHSWRVTFEFTALDDDSYAACSINFENKSAVLSLTNCVFKSSVEETPKTNARHEVLELLLSDLNCMAKVMFSNREVDERRHEVIRVLENLI